MRDIPDVRERSIYLCFCVASHIRDISYLPENLLENLHKNPCLVDKRVSQLGSEHKNALICSFKGHFECQKHKFGCFCSFESLFLRHDPNRKYSPGP